MELGIYSFGEADPSVGTLPHEKVLHAVERRSVAIPMPAGDPA